MGEQLQFVLQYFSSFSTMERVHSKYDLDLQVRQRKNLTELHGNMWTRRMKVKASYELSHISSICRVPKKPLAFGF